MRNAPRRSLRGFRLGFGFRSRRGSAVAGPSAYLGQVATRGIVANIYGTTNKAGMFRRGHFARGSLSAIQIAIPNWYINNGVETNVGGTTTIHASIEYPVGTFTQVLFAGSATGTAAAGDTLLSDVITVSIPDGAEFFTRIHWTSVGGTIASFISPNRTGDGTIFATSTTADLTMGGTVTQSGQYNFGPCAIIGQTTRASVFLVGDSRVVGVLDSGDAAGDFGELARSIGPTLAYINTAASAERAAWFAVGNAKQVALSAYCSHILCELGEADIKDALASAAAVKTNLQTIVALFPPTKPFYMVTYAPYSTGTYTTEGGQTTHTTNSVRITANTNIRTGAIAGVDAYFELADVVESARDSGIWKANYTTDGVHESPAGTTAIRDSGVITLSSFTRS